MSDPRVPVSVLTGFLGAGKTTLLDRLVRRTDLTRTAILVNEVGAVSIDHHLVRAVEGDVVVLGSGCVCCTVAGDLVRALLELHGQAARGEVPGFDRVVLETTGLADPTGVTATLIQHPLVSRGYRPAAVVTAVDATLGAATLAHQPESVTQVALADRLVVTKVDLADDATTAALIDELRRRNRAAPIVTAAGGEVEPDVLLAPAPGSDDDGPALSAWLAAAACGPGDDHDHHHDRAAVGPPARTGHGVHAEVITFAVAFAEPVRIGALGLWLTLMTQMHGGALLRVKGLVNVVGTDTPVVVHAVQQIVYPARPLPAWPDDDRRTRLVFVARGLTRSTIASLQASLADTLGQPVIDPT